MSSVLCGFARVCPVLGEINEKRSKIGRFLGVNHRLTVSRVYENYDIDCCNRNKIKFVIDCSVAWTFLELKLIVNNPGDKFQSLIDKILEVKMRKQKPMP